MKTPKYFYKVTKNGEPIPGTLARLPEKPENGKWIEVKSVCCTPECNPTQDTTAGDSFTLSTWFNGATEDVDIISATNSFSVVGNTITLYNGKTSSIVVARIPKLNQTEDFDVGFNLNDGWNNCLLDYSDDPEDSDFQLVTFGIEFSPYDPSNLLLAGNIVVQNTTVDDLYLSVQSRTAKLFDTTEKIIVSDSSATLIQLDFTATPSANYDIKFYLRNTLVHTVSGLSVQNYTMNSNTVTDTKYDKIVVSPS